MEEHVVESCARIVLDLNDKIRVLHVDDDSGILKITKQCLEMKGPIQVDTAISVEEALVRLEKDRYDVVVSDYKMPERDGLDFLKALRTKKNSIPFIMFTGKGREEVAVKALNLGANQCLNKVGEAETVYVELAHSIIELAKTRRAEEKLCESEEKFRDLFEKANDGLVFVDLSGRIVDLNQKAAEIAEKRREDIVGKSFHDLGLVSLNDVPVLVEKLSQQATGKPIEMFEFEIERQNGKKKSIEISVSVIQKNDVPTGSLAIVRDITKRKEIERALQENEERYRSLFEQSPLGIGMATHDGKVVDANKTVEALLGYSRKELKHINLLDLYEKPEQRKELLEAVKQHGVLNDFQARLKHKEGTSIAALMNVSLVHVGGKSLLQTTLQDVTERKKAEEKIESLARFPSENPNPVLRMS